MGDSFTIKTIERYASYLPINKFGLPQRNINVNDKSIVNLKPDSQDASAVNVELVHDFIANMI